MAWAELSRCFCFSSADATEPDAAAARPVNVDSLPLKEEAAPSRDDLACGSGPSTPIKRGPRKCPTRGASFYNSPQASRLLSITGAGSFKGIKAFNPEELDSPSSSLTVARIRQTLDDSLIAKLSSQAVMTPWIEAARTLEADRRHRRRSVLMGEEHARANSNPLPFLDGESVSGRLGFLSNVTNGPRSDLLYIGHMDASSNTLSDSDRLNNGLPAHANDSSPASGTSPAHAANNSETESGAAGLMEYVPMTDPASLERSQPKLSLHTIDESARCSSEWDGASPARAAIMAMNTIHSEVADLCASTDGNAAEGEAEASFALFGPDDNGVRVSPATEAGRASPHTNTDWTSPEVAQLSASSNRHMHDDRPSRSQPLPKLRFNLVQTALYQQGPTIHTPSRCSPARRQTSTALGSQPSDGIPPSRGHASGLVPAESSNFARTSYTTGGALPDKPRAPKARRVSFFLGGGLFGLHGSPAGPAATPSQVSQAPDSSNPSDLSANFARTSLPGTNPTVEKSRAPKARRASFFMGGSLFGPSGPGSGDSLPQSHSPIMSIFGRNAKAAASASPPQSKVFPRSPFDACAALDAAYTADHGTSHTSMGEWARPSRTSIGEWPSHYGTRRTSMGGRPPRMSMGDRPSQYRSWRASIGDRPSPEQPVAAAVEQPWSFAMEVLEGGYVECPAPPRRPELAAQIFRLLAEQGHKGLVMQP